MIIRSSQVSGFYLALIMLAGVAPYLVSDADVVRGLVVTLVLAPMAVVVPLLYLVQRRFPTRPSIPPRDGVFAITALVGAYGVGLGIACHNAWYYLLADCYHWFIEFLAVAIVTTISLRRMSSRDAVYAILASAILTGTVVASSITLAYCGWELNGVSELPGTWIPRIKVGTNYPEILLLMATSALFWAPHSTRLRRYVGYVCVAALLFLLLLTFKRTMWISFVICSTVILPKKRAFARAIALAIMLFFPAITALLTLDDSWFERLGVLTINPQYTIEDTLRDRSSQLHDAFVAAGVAPCGRGFGAEFFVYVPPSIDSAGGVDRTHFIHNIGVYYLLQLGWMGVTVAAVPWFVVFGRTLGNVGRQPEWEWLVRGGLASLCAIVLNGVTLNSLHSVFSGMAFGACMAVDSVIRQNVTQSESA